MERESISHDRSIKQPGKKEWGRTVEQLREIRLSRHYTRHAKGSVLAEFGDTKVLCNASVNASVPSFLQGAGQGWVTVEYGMLPRSTGTRMQREAARGRQSGRTLEIQRLIGRALRAAVELPGLGEHTIRLDCDVIQADGGTRTAAITGGCITLADGLDYMLAETLIAHNPLRQAVAVISVGLCEGVALPNLS